MRYVILGAGAVGGTVGGRLFGCGREVVLIARGSHGRVLRERGLELRDPAGRRHLAIPVVSRADEIDWRDDDVVVLATKSQDTASALQSLVASWDGHRPVMCVQNGVDNERVVSRLCPEVYGACVMLPAEHLHPGVVTSYAVTPAGILDVGRYPRGTDVRAEAVASDLVAAGFRSRPEPDIMRWKYSKLLFSLGNVLEAACGAGAPVGDLYAEARSEALRCFEAAGIGAVSGDEQQARRRGVVTTDLVDGSRRGGGSTWQSLARSSGSVETDFLNGEIVLLGRQHGIATPVNELLQCIGNRMARAGLAPGSVSPPALLADWSGKRPQPARQPLPIACSRDTRLVT